MLALVMKGERDYVTGADILMELLRVTDAVRELSLRFHRLTGNEIEAVPLSPEDPVTELDGVFLFRTAAGAQRRLGLRAVPDRPVKERVPYPEDLAIADASIDGQTIRSEAAEGFSFIERAIALNKLLLTRLCGTDKSTKWIFTRIDIPERPRMPMPVVSLTASSIANPRLIRSELKLDGQPFGQIWFAAIKQPGVTRDG
jgi:hypothetical protein